MSKSLRNWIVTLRAKIIICNLILTLKITIDHISISTRLMSTLHDRLDPVIMWPYEVVWLIKNDISLLPQGLCLPDLTRWRFIVKDNHSWSLLKFWSCDQVIKWLTKNVISQLPPMVTKLDRVMGFNVGLLSSSQKPFDHVVT